MQWSSPDFVNIIWRSEQGFVENIWVKGFERNLQISSGNEIVEFDIWGRSKA